MTSRIGLKSVVILVVLVSLLTGGLVYALTIQRSVQGLAAIGRVLSVEETLLLWSSIQPSKTALTQVNFGTLDIDAFGTLRTPRRIPMWVENGGSTPFQVTVEASGVQVTRPGTGALVMNDALRILFGPAGGVLKPAPDHALLVNPGTGNMVAGELSLEFLKTPDRLGPTGTQIALDIVFRATSVVGPTPIPPPAGMVSWWPGDGNANDIVDGNHGTLRNGATFAAGKVGQAFSFDGVDDYVEVSDSSSLHSNNEITIDGWFKVNNFDKGWQSIYWKGNVPDCSTGCENREYALWINSAGYLHFTSTPVSRIGVGQLFLNTVSGSIQTGNWYHFATVISSSGNYMRIYVNGDLQSFTSYDGSGIRDTTGPFRIGNNPSWNTHLNGFVDELEIFNRALSAAEIKAIYDAGSAGKRKPAQ